MKGSLVIKNGYYYGIIYYKDENGVNKQKWVNTKLKERGNKKEAKKILDNEIKLFEQQLNGENNVVIKQEENVIRNGDLYSTMPFMDLINYYIDKKAKIIDPITVHGYRIYTNQYQEYFGKNNVKVCDVTTEMLNDFYNYHRKRGLSETTIKHYATVLNPALKLAYNSKIIDRNPAEMVDPIKRQKYRGEYYDKNDMEKLFEVIKGSKIEDAIKVACYYGFRRSEIIGLQWDAVDFEKKTITVKNKVVFVDGQIYASEKLKTRASYRTLPLIKDVEDILINLKKKTEANQKFFGNCYNHTYDSYLFVNDMGELRRPSYLSHEFEMILKKNGLKQIRFHDLRHSCASLLIANGIPIKQIQEWLGHANFGTTADIYSHLDFNSKKESANTLKDVFTFSSPEEKEKTVEEPEKVEIDKDLYEEFEEFRQWKAKRKKQKDFEM